ncbi:hypothetical protein [Staphylococcus delphini]|uniref:hypothetical protein n=1 Tax=Staphylococcus delphini TaxID=53344 RepID=UPI0021CDFEA4|nr:hypothetical protein [Staphylococcus delphini]UXS37855.1 hypothetical protein MUA34_05515 [Staphylococcus delphini]UXS43571.1 hypothetical protein MUA39_09365 [Staphylococcus delphini]UXS45334.1 hypothetical protein MUA39_05630 [Staphylococcus delphini]UXS57019.1 hypothetical protein MUA44_09265 [Staphylococcus delphini]UXV44265.1 hypothetical protein MUA63_09340 [Staphylococcus delphini]
MKNNGVVIFSYAELQRLILAEYQLERENEELKERLKTLESLYRFQSKEVERLKEVLDSCTLENDEEEELLDD